MISMVSMPIFAINVTQATQILQEEKKNKVEIGNLPLSKLIKPKEIKVSR